MLTFSQRLLENQDQRRIFFGSRRYTLGDVSLTLSDVCSTLKVFSKVFCPQAR